MRTCKLLAALWLCTQFIGAPYVAHGDVTGELDVSPQSPVDLPIDGGPVSETIIVGGAGNHDSEFGLLTYDQGLITMPLESTGGVFGATPNSIGQGFISSLGADWQIDGILSVGQEGTGLLEIFNSGRVTTNIDNMTGVDDIDVLIGELEFSQGIIRVVGFASRIENRDMVVGNEGIGRLVVEQEGRAISDSVIVGREVEGTGYVEVSGRGTNWIATEEVIVGEEGRGYVEIFDEAVARTPKANIGLMEDTYGEVRVSDFGSQWHILEDLNVGNPAVPNARGVLWISNDALVRVQDEFSTGTGTTVARDGRIEMRGGTLLSSATVNDGMIRGYGRLETPLTNGEEGEIRNAADLANQRERLLYTHDVSNAGLIEVIGGEMEFEEMVTNDATGKIFGRDAIYRFGTTLERSATHLENDGQLALSFGVSDVHGNIHNASGGEIVVGHDADATFVNMVDNDGTLAVMPGGTALFLEDLAFANPATLLLQLSSTSSALLPQLQVQGEALLDGTIDVSLSDGFVPEVGDSFQVITADNVTGTFSTEVLPLVSGISWSVDYTATTVTLNAEPGGAFFNADFNLDGIVDGADLTIWQRNYLTGTTQAEGDADGDGVVDDFDRTVWEFQFGGPPSVAASAAVPEPSSLLLAICGLAAFAAARRR